MATDIAKVYQATLDALVGPGRVTACAIHEDKDLCIRSSERELLLAIQNVQHRQHDVEWLFRENMYGKALTLRASNHVSATMTGFAEEYKQAFQKRTQMILERYDTKPLEESLRAFYEQVKASYVELLARPSVDFDEYKKVRDLFERVRY